MNRKHRLRGSGFLMVFAIFILMAMLGLSLYRYKAFESNIKLESSIRDSLQASYATEYAFEKSIEFLETGFQEARTLGTFNGDPVISIPLANCSVPEGIAAGCFKLSKSIDIDPADRLTNPSLPEHAAFFILCEGNCGLTPDYQGASRVKIRLAVAKDGALESWEIAAVVGKGSIYNPGYYEGGDDLVGYEINRPVHSGGAKSLTKAALYQLKQQCAAGKDTYTAYLKKFFQSRLCPAATTEVSYADVETVTEPVTQSSVLTTTSSVNSRVLSNVLNYEGSLQKFATNYYSMLGFASENTALSSLAAMSDNDFVNNIYASKLSSKYSASALELTTSVSPITSNTSYSVSMSAIVAENATGGRIEVEKDLSSASKTSTSVKVIQSTPPDDLSFDQVCGANSTYPNYESVDNSIGNWVDDIKLSAEPQITKVNCGSSCQVEVDCVSNVHQVKVIRGNGTQVNYNVTSNDAILYSDQALAIRKARYCSDHDSKPLTIVSDDSIVIEAPVIASKYLGMIDADWSKDKLEELSREHERKLAFVSTKDITIDPTKMKSLKVGVGDALELSTNVVAAINESASPEEFGGRVEAHLAAKENIKIATSQNSGKPVEISGSVAAKKIFSHTLAANNSGTCVQIGSRFEIKARPPKAGRGPVGPPLDGAVAVDIIRIRKGNTSNDLALGQ